MPLADILAGPMLRRSEPDRVCIWLATSRAFEVRATVRAAAGHPGEDPLGRGSGTRVALGPGLHVHLVPVRPTGAPFPTDTLLSYDLEVELDGDRRDLASLGLLEGASGLGYGDHRLPTFFLRGPGTPELIVLHGSCRLLHGKGEDAFRAADEVLAGTVDDCSRRPSALLLTGDQIYADEVAGPLIGHLTRLGAELLGPGDDTSVPGLPPLSSIPAYGRQSLAEERAGFTSGKAQNHLFSLGEFAAAYLVAWREANWPPHWPLADHVLGPVAGENRQRSQQRTQFHQEVSNLEAARRALPAVSRVLANVPTYTCFDDHDVTDDWNLTREWRRRVEASPTGRRAVANALVSFWAFQGWGNQPDSFDDAFIETVGAGATGDHEARARLDALMWDFDKWSYRLPAEPPVIVLDTRTQRSFDSERGAAWLMGEPEQRRLARLVADRTDQTDPVVLVSPVPVFGLELQERRQKFLAGRLGPYEIDFEAWHSNLAGFVRFMHLLIGELGVRRCVILSGDVHYGLNVSARFFIDEDELEVVQVISSSFKHSGTLEKSALHALGRLVRGGSDRLGWDRAPELAAGNGLVQRLLSRAVNTDEWSEDAPVFLPRRLAERLDADPPPRYRETRAYVDPEERPRWVLVGENNIGLFSLGEGGAVHRLLCPHQSGATTYTARLPFHR